MSRRGIAGEYETVENASRERLPAFLDSGRDATWSAAARRSPPSN